MRQLSFSKKSDEENEQLAWMRLARTNNVGPITFYRLLERFGSANDALNALPDMAQRGGRSKPLKAPPIGVIEKEIKALKKIGGNIVTAAQDSYPMMLKAIDDPPPILSYIGDIELANKSCIGVVGARNASLNGRKIAEKISRDLGAYNHIIASGLARGIDTSAHIGALESGTIAVVAGGIDSIYPEENTKLYHDIAKRGLILAESALGQKPFAASFPRRNRIVSGLSKAIIVIESTMRSGSLITARLANEQGRDVFAVPGSPLDPRSQGPNHLIREGATLIRGADDVLDSLNDFLGHQLEERIQPQSFSYTPASNDFEIPENAHKNVLENLSFSPITVDELIRSCHLSIPAMQTILLDLELAGRVKRLPGGRISLLSEE